MTQILTHRGLDPSIPDFPLESSQQAFQNQLYRNFGLEFDICFLADDSIAVIHDDSLERISAGQDKRKLSEIGAAEFLSISIQGCNFLLLENLFTMLATSQAPLHALHFKGKLQSEKNIINLARLMNCYPEIRSRIIVFDLYPQSAKLLSDLSPGLNLACSVSKAFDIARYGQKVCGTLLSLEEFKVNKNLFSWVWLDEWDVCSESGEREELYTQKIFSTIKEQGAKIALVTPELHATSPGLLGAESHQDAATIEILEARLARILALLPDAVCTDYPDLVSGLLDSK